MFSIGVSGHRDISLDQNLKNALHGVFDTITEWYPGNEFRVLSPLAEGADRIIAQFAMQLLSAQLIVPLPLQPDDYVQDFSTKESMENFFTLINEAKEVISIPHKQNREESYLAVGEYVINHCDILIVLWDGYPARGIGGTGHIVQIARERKVPYIWINPTETPITTRYVNLPGK